MKKIYMILKVFCSMTLLMSWNIFYSTVLAQSISHPVVPSLAPMVSKIIPSVVSVNVEGIVSVKKRHLPNLHSQLFNRNLPLCTAGFSLKKISFYQEFLKKNNIYRKTFHALGSGVIINSKKGYVVTNNHVIINANKINVQLSDGRCYQATAVGQDPRSDIALLKLNLSNNLTAITISDSDLLKVGDFTVAVGNPYGLGETVTSGIISALGRSGLHLENYENFIQTDAAINRGNSGGALVNLKGELIGINTAILAPDGGNIGIGFAIPSNMINKLIQQMIKFGHIKRGQLGIVGTELNSDLSKIMKINTSRGAFVNEVLPFSSADKSGIKSGDIIVSVNKKIISSFSMLRSEISISPINKEINFVVLRDGLLHTILVTLKNNIKEKTVFFNAYKCLNGAFFYDYCDIQGNKSVKVHHVLKDSFAFHYGLKKNDIIIDVNKSFIYTLKDLKIVFSQKVNVLILHIKRDNNMIYLVLQE